MKVRMTATPSLERRMLAMAGTLRRHHILRLAAPGLLMYTLVVVLSSGARLTPLTIAQVVVGGVAFGVALWGITGQVVPWRVSLAMVVTLGASLLTTVLFIWASGPLDGVLGLPTLAALFLLLVPIIIAGMLGDVWLVIVTALLAFGFTVLLLLAMPLTGDLQGIFQAHHELVVVLALPVIAQVGAAFMLIAGASGAGRMQQILVDWRMAYAREREVDQMREEFIASINHELRNPIMAVQNYLMLANLLGERGDAAGQQQMIQRGVEVADHLSGLMESIMSIRRLRTAQQVVTLAPVALHALAERAANMVMLLDGNGPHSIHLALDRTLVVMGHEGLLTETLSNLLTNAAKYSDPQTTITVAARRIAPRDLARERPQFDAARDGEYIDVTISDQGMGIPPDKAPLIFEPFVRLGRDEASSVIGSGMGLAIVRSNVTALHGDIWVESDGVAGHGSTFHLILGATGTSVPVPDLPTQKRTTVAPNDIIGSGS